MKKYFSSLTVLCAVFLASCGGGGTSSTDAANDSNEAKLDTRDENEIVADSSQVIAQPVSEYDTKFVVEAASGGMMEVQAGTAASQKATSARVKNFAEMLVKDHTSANNELKSLAGSKNITLPDSVGEKHKDHLEDVQKKSGRDFDRAYMSMMVDDHKEDVRNFEKASTDASDPQIKAFASKTLPVLRAHLDSANAIYDALKKMKK